MKALRKSPIVSLLLPNRLNKQPLSKEVPLFSSSSSNNSRHNRKGLLQHQELLLHPRNSKQLRNIRSSSNNFHTRNIIPAIRDILNICSKVLHLRVTALTEVTRLRPVMGLPAPECSLLRVIPECLLTVITDSIRSSKE